MKIFQWIKYLKMKILPFQRQISENPAKPEPQKRQNQLKSPRQAEKLQPQNQHKSPCKNQHQVERQRPPDQKAKQNRCHQLIVPAAIQLAKAGFLSQIGGIKLDQWSTTVAIMDWFGVVVFGAIAIVVR